MSSIPCCIPCGLATRKDTLWLSRIHQVNKVVEQTKITNQEKYLIETWAQID